jgi:hypothetical protein
MKIENCKNIFCSVSSGYSSVMMAIILKDLYPDYKIVYGMANVSKERKESLEFMNECDKYFNLNLNWIETVFKKRGISFVLKNYHELLTNGEIYENGIQKLGVPSKINTWCNRDMKTVPMKKFADSIFGKNNYSIAIGIRSDEIDRISKNYKTNNIFYPLIDENIDSIKRNKFWENQPIKIKIPAFKGNCDFCFKKSKRKLLTILSDEPNTVDWWLKMENKYSNIEIKGKPLYNSYVKKGGFFFNRLNQPIPSIIEDSKKPFKKATDEYINENYELDNEDDCGVSCSAFND